MTPTRPSQPPRVVLDTNVAVSTLVISAGPAARLRLVSQALRCVPLISRATIQELVRVLGYPKFQLSADEQHELLADYLPYCTTVRIPNPPPAVPPCRNPFDTPFLHLAVAGNAQYLVTGDHDLHALAVALPFGVVTADTLLQALGD